MKSNLEMLRKVYNASKNPDGYIENIKASCIVSLGGFVSINLFFKLWKARLNERFKFEIGTEDAYSVVIHYELISPTFDEAFDFFLEYEDLFGQNTVN